MDVDKVRKNDTERNWEDMDENMLLKIFMGLNMIDLIIRVSGVCQSWQKISRDQCFWHTLDLDKLMETFLEPENNYLTRDYDIMQILRSALVQSQKHVTTFITTICLDLDVADWVLIGELTPKLKKLVMPLQEKTSLWGFCKTVKRWPLLESLTVGEVIKSKNLIKAIGKNCPNFSELKLMTFFQKDVANSIVTFMPNLKVLSLRGCSIYEEALYIILDKLEHLEVLNLSHCIYCHYPPRPEGHHKLFPVLDDEMRMKTAKLKRLILCPNIPCNKCLYVVKHCIRAMAKMDDYDDSFWKEDEISTLGI